MRHILLMRWLLMRWQIRWSSQMSLLQMTWSSQMSLLLILSHLLLLTQRLWLLWQSHFYPLMEDFREDPLIGRCLSSMLTMYEAPLKYTYALIKNWVRDILICFYPIISDPLFIQLCIYFGPHKIVDAITTIQYCR